MSLLPTHWYYNTETGQLTQGNNLENLGNNLVGGAGWHELTIPGNATATQAAAEAAKEFPDGKTPTTAGITAGRVAGVAAQEAGAALPKWTAAITGFNGTNFLLRALKVIAGAVLLVVGLVHITGADNAVAGLARKVPLPV